MNVTDFTATLLFSSLLAGQAQTLPEALDSPALVWSTGGETPWRGVVSDTAKNGGDLARCGPFTEAPYAWIEGSSGWMETTVTGPGTFRIYVRSNGNPYLSASLSVDGAITDTWNWFDSFALPAVVSPWKALTAPLSAGPHTVRLAGCFLCHDGGTIPLSSPMLEADAASVLPPLVAAGDAMEAPEQTWLTGGETGFSVVTDVTHDGVDALYGPAQNGTGWLETRVTGPATVSWWRKGRSEIFLDGLRFASEIKENWTQETAFFPASDAIVRWDELDYGTGGVWVDEFAVQPAATVTLAEGLDTPGRVFTSNNWHAHTSAAAPDGNDMVWTRTAPGAGAWMETVIEGPALVEFEAQGRGFSLLEVTVDGLGLLNFQGGYNETRSSESFFLTAGSHVVRWQVPVDPPHSGGALFMLDRLRISSAAAMPLAEALDSPGLTWISPGTVSWQAAPAALSQDGTDTTYSPPLAEGQTAVLETTMTGPGTFSFFWTTKVKGGSTRLMMDGLVLQRTVPSSGPLNQWRREAVEVPAGRHTFRGEVTGACGAGALLVDQVLWNPEAVPPLAPALDVPPTIFQASALGGIGLDAVIHSDGTDSLRLAASSPGDTSGFLGMWIAGPASVTFRTRSVHGSLVVQGEEASTQQFVQTEWTNGGVLVPPGMRRLQFFPRANYDVPAEPFSWIDALTITSTAIPLADGLTAQGWTWRTNPANPWSGISASGTLPPRVSPGLMDTADSSWLETTLTGPAVVEFTAAGFLDLWLDGALFSKVNYPYETAARRSVWIPRGEHALRWLRSEYSPVLPWLASFSAASMNGEPTLKQENGQWLYTVPRPAGFADSRVSLESGTSPASLYSFINFTVERSNPDEIVFRIQPDVGAAKFFLRAKFRP
ncbi:MAG: hypothetical protein V4675_12095 [Verrucomicrobiota bacterium]